MKRFALTLLLLTSTLSCFGQSLFFDNLNNSTWISTLNFENSRQLKLDKIPLNKFTFSTDSLKTTTTIWDFNNGELTIAQYDSQSKTRQFDASYLYEVNEKKGGIRIFLDQETSVSYKVGITSTGNFALLIRKRPRHSKD